jgi:hypothetical protein
VFYSKFTGKRSAARNNSGESVHPSDPGLGLEPTTSPTSDRKSEACPPDLLEGSSQPKTGREFEGSALVGAEGAVPSSLDLIESNRDRQLLDKDLDDVERLRRAAGSNNALGRRGFCGRAVVVGKSRDGGNDLIHRLNCKCWGCPYCGPRKATRYRKAISRVAESKGLNKFITLTLDPSKIEGDSVQYIREVFNLFRVYLRRKCGRSPQYIAILEFQKNGNAHLHVLIDHYIEQKWLSESWSAIGGGHIVDVRFVDVHRIAKYLSKYLTKDLLLSAPPKSRRVTTSRGIRLLEKPESKHDWEMLRTTISYFAKKLWGRVSVIEVDEFGVLASLEIKSDLKGG